MSPSLVSQQKDGAFMLKISRNLRLYLKKKKCEAPASIEEWRENNRPYPSARYPAQDIVLRATRANLHGNVPKITAHNAWSHNTDFHRD